MQKPIPRTKRVLNKGEDGVIYQKETAKFSRATKIKLMEDQLLVLQVFSAYYQPKIIVNDTSGKKLKTSTHLPSRKTKLDDGKDATLYATEIEFLPPDRGVFPVIVTTEEINQGPYWTQGAVWRPSTPAEDAMSFDQTPLKAVEDTSQVDTKTEFSSKGSYRYKKNYVDPNNKNQFGNPTLMASFTVSWKTSDYKHKPSAAPVQDASNVEAVRDNVIYYKAIMNNQTGKLIRKQATSFDPDREIYVSIRTDAPYSHLLPELVEQAKKKMKEYSTRARSRTE